MIRWLAKTLIFSLTKIRNWSFLQISFKVQNVLQERYADNEINTDMGIVESTLDHHSDQCAKTNQDRCAKIIVCAKRCAKVAKIIAVDSSSFNLDIN